MIAEHYVHHTYVCVLYTVMTVHHALTNESTHLNTVKNTHFPIEDCIVHSLIDVVSTNSCSLKALQELIYRCLKFIRVLLINVVAGMTLVTNIYHTIYI